MTSGADNRWLLIQLPAEDLAELCGVSVKEAERWQQGRKVPPPPVIKLLVMRLTGGAREDGSVSETVRARGVRLRTRMMRFGAIYNAAWFVRSAQHGSPEGRAAKAAAFAEVLRNELEDCNDEEALIYAVADALTADPNGVPWER